MRELQPPDSHHVNAATGWLELGNLAEAKGALAALSSLNRDHPDVLELHWRIHAEEKDWPSSVTVAQRLIRAEPASPAGWINQSFSLHELKRTREAWDQLVSIRCRPRPGRSSRRSRSTRCG